MAERLSGFGRPRTRYILLANHDAATFEEGERAAFGTFPPVLHNSTK